jgi:toxin-antitoxin system PIN domain toxin
VSYAFDANLLLYASDKQSPFHETAVEFLERCASGGMFYLAWPTVMAYLRISTHPKIFKQPLPLDDALANVESLLQLPQCRLLSEDEGFWSVYRSTVKDAPARGNLAPDAHLVALLRLSRVKKLYSADSDFRRFTGIDVENPFRVDDK